jgi:copper chaperone NosL
MVKGAVFVLLSSLLLTLAGCSGDPGTGAKEVKWDRDACERCRMVLSDRKHSAQVRYFPEGKKRSQVLMFDDFGCAVLWLEDKPWRDDPGTEIWVTDRKSGQWIDARKAVYIKGDLTPMEYGLGAQLSAQDDVLTFEQAKLHVFDVEKRFNAHGVDLLARLQQLKEKREAGDADPSNHTHTSGESGK